PLAPMGMTVFSAAGLHSTEADSPQPRLAHLDQVLPWMEASRTWGLSKTCVHVIDREGDSLKHLRQWDAAGHRFLIRGDDRRVQFRGQSQLLSQIVKVLHQEGALVATGQVSIRGRSAEQWVAESEVIIDGRAWGQTRE